MKYVGATKIESMKIKLLSYISLPYKLIFSFPVKSNVFLCDRTTIQSLAHFPFILWQMRGREEGLTFTTRSIRGTSYSPLSPPSSSQSAAWCTIRVHLSISIITTMYNISFIFFFLYFLITLNILTMTSQVPLIYWCTFSPLNDILFNIYNGEFY